jgi:predicted lipase
MSDVKTFNNNIGEIFGFVGYSNALKSIVITFRSSQNLKNWIVNIVTTLTPYLHCSKCKVHTGFDAGFNMVKIQVRTLVKDLVKKYPEAEIIVNGHSLGGALAILASVDLKLHIGKVSSVYTFGQPRVGNS